MTAKGYQMGTRCPVCGGVIPNDPAYVCAHNGLGGVPVSGPTTALQRATLAITECRRTALIKGGRVPHEDLARRHTLVVADLDL